MQKALDNAEKRKYNQTRAHKMCVFPVQKGTVGADIVCISSHNRETVLGQGHKKANCQKQFVKSNLSDERKFIRRWKIHAYI